MKAGDGPERLGFDGERLRTLSATLRASVEDGRVPAMSFLLERHGEPVLEVHAGIVSRATGMPVSDTTLYRLYSMTKPITSAALFILFEEAAWRFEDPLSLHLPELAGLRVGVVHDGSLVDVASEREPTMRDLMLHMAGFTYGFTDNDHPVDRLYREHRILDHDADYATFLQRLRRLPLVSQPGAVWRYGVSHDVAAAIVERLSGRRFGEFLAERMFGPLRMCDTAFVVQKDKVDRLATLHGHDAAGVLTDEPQAVFPIHDVRRAQALESGGGGLVGTLKDYRRFGHMMHSGGAIDGIRVLAPATVKLMRAPLAITNDPPPIERTYSPGGYYFYRDSIAAGSTTGAGTAFAGGAAGTWYWSDPEYDIMVIGLISVLSWKRGPELRSLVERLVYSALVDPAR